MLREATAGDADAIAALVRAQNEREGTLDSAGSPVAAVVRIGDGGTIDAAGWREERATRTVLQVFARDAGSIEDVMRSLIDSAPGGRAVRIERVLQAGTSSLPAGTTAIYERAGFEFVYVELEMARDLASLPGPPPLADVCIEGWRPEHDARLRAAYNDAFSTRGFRGYSEEEWQDQRFSAQDDFLPEASLVCTAGVDIAGFVMCVAAGVEGWIDSVGVRPAWRARGIADALLVRSMQAMRGAGMKYAVLRVNEDNDRAIAVYRRLGFEVRWKHAAWTRPMEPA